MLIHFRVTCGDTKLGESVYVVGSVDGLGSWSPAGAIRLMTDERTFPLWSGCVELPDNTYIEWKLLAKGDTELRWETLDRNRVLAGLTGVSEATVHAFFGSLQSTVECVKREPIATPVVTPMTPTAGPDLISLTPQHTQHRQPAHHHARRGHGQRQHGSHSSANNAAAYVKPSGQIGYYTLNGTPQTGPKKSRSCASFRRVPSFLDPIAEELNGGVSASAIEFYDSDYDRRYESDSDDSSRGRRGDMIHSPTSINLSYNCSGDIDPTRYELTELLLAARVPTHTQ